MAILTATSDIFDFALEQMQPHAIKKFRMLSPIALGMILLTGTSVVLYSYRKWFRPWQKRRNYDKSEMFIDELFEKIEQIEKEDYFE